jgi:hypothetical protein
MQCRFASDVEAKSKTLVFARRGSDIAAYLRSIGAPK